jgi:peptidyl-prolyl cis-trans isomerase B (cyclophilin B)
MHQDAPHLDGAYASFGKVIEGMETVDFIATVNTDYSDKPLQPVIMEKVEVDTFGIEYPQPTKVK